MSVIRIYGSTIINLTRALSVSKSSTDKIHFVFPISNYYSGNSSWSNDRQSYEFAFESQTERDKEHSDIADSLKKYYQKP